LLRIVNDDMEFRGKRMRANDWVILELASANKDEREFADPHRFDITRTPNEHLGLGTGIHACLGRALVRLELAIFFPRVFAAFPRLEPIVTQPNWIQDIQATGLTSLLTRTNRVSIPA
jgi:cholest-4-en-3-one 26-monooxygenase